uniref:Putative integral membrane n=1 Tax=Cercospora beticola TaxID=122368 RepID=A0A023PKB0_CERBT|nr:putative integral membrane [Cercospora beticola]
MTLRALLYAYVIGGLTFIPLLVAAILIPAWYLLPRAEQGKSSGQRDGDDGEKRDSKTHRKGPHARSFSGDAAASGTFAVLRRYDFQAALTALNGRTNSTTSVGGNTISDGLASPEGATNASSESVYQSMYRSVFTGSKNNGSTSSVLHDANGQEVTAGRKPVPANLLYIVLRHGHLMLYDSPAQVEVKHVLSLAHHKVTLQAGKDDDEDCKETNILEADLFTKRTAIVLTPVDLPNGALQTPSQSQAKPFYLFTATNIDKEDFYHALIAHRAHPPTPKALEPNALIKLQSALHSSSLTPETRALDALVGRIFLAIHRTDTLSSFMRGKLEKKLNRIQKPAFIPSLLVQSIHLGDAGPVFSSLKLRELNIDGEMVLSADMKYNGGLAVTLLAVAKLDLGTRFKVRTVDLALKTVIERISGTMLLRIKPPPSNRLWFCFENVPELDVRVEPIVSERKITYGFILRAIEDRVRLAFKEGLVKPNWDDVPMPFTDTRGTSARGGLWSDRGATDTEVASDAEHALSERNEKTASMPSLPQGLDTGVSSGVSPVHSGIRGRETTSVEAGTDKSPRPPRPLRAASTSSSPSTAVDGQNVEPVRGEDAGRLAQQPRRLWRPRTTTATAITKDAAEELRDLQLKAERLMSSANEKAGEEVGRTSDLDQNLDNATTQKNNDDRSSIHSPESSSKGSAASTRTPSMRSTVSSTSTAAPSVASETTHAGRKANLLAATVNATTAAKNWGWNAIQRNRGAITRPEQKQDLVAQQPLGRGMPLPPPGQPLPGPQKGLWGSVNSLRRRPVPGPGPLHAEPMPPTEQATEEEFQPFQENSGERQYDTRSESSIARGVVDASSHSDPGEHNDNEQRKDTETSAAVSRRDREPDTKGASTLDVEPSHKNPPPLPARPPKSVESAGLPPNSSSLSGSPSSTRASSKERMTRSSPLEADDGASPAKQPKHARSRSSTSLLVGSTPAVTDEAVATTPVPALSAMNAQSTPQDTRAAVSDSLRAAQVASNIPSSGAQKQHDAVQVHSATKELDVRSESELQNDNNGADKISVHSRSSMEDRIPVLEKERTTVAQHKTSPSIGFSDGWPSN